MFSLSLSLSLFREIVFVVACGRTLVERRLLTRAELLNYAVAFTKKPTTNPTQFPLIDVHPDVAIAGKFEIPSKMIVERNSRTWRRSKTATGQSKGQSRGKKFLNGKDERQLWLLWRRVSSICTKTSSLPAMELPRDLEFSRHSLQEHESMDD